MNINLKNRQILIQLGLFWAFFITILRTLRWPNDWAEAQWLISYQFGFIKRALPGTLITPLINHCKTDLQIFWVIRIMSVLFFFLFCVGLLWICFRIVTKSGFNINMCLACFVFLTSPYIVMSAHLIGYFDNIIVIIILLACLGVFRQTLWLSSIMLSIGVFIHENIILIGFPLVIFFAFVQHIKKAENSNFYQLSITFLSRYKALYMIPIPIFLGHIITQLFFLDPVIIQKKLISHLSQFSFIHRDRNILVPVTLTTSFFEYMATQARWFFQRVTKPVYLLHTGLPLLILLGSGWHILRKVDFNRMIFICFMIISLIPLLLLALAWDRSRIWTYPILTAFFALWGLCEFFSSDIPKESNSLFFNIIAIMIIVFQLFILTPLMDDAVERFSNGMRILLYSPALIVIAMFFLKPLLLNKKIED